MVATPYAQRLRTNSQTVVRDPVIGMCACAGEGGGGPQPTDEVHQQRSVCACV